MKKSTVVLLVIVAFLSLVYANLMLAITNNVLDENGKVIGHKKKQGLALLIALVVFVIRGVLFFRFVKWIIQAIRKTA